MTRLRRTTRKRAHVSSAAGGTEQESHLTDHVIPHVPVRQWVLKFGPEFAKKLRHRQGQPGDTWHLDEVVVTIGGKRHYLWRAVDQDHSVLDMGPETP